MRTALNLPALLVLGACLSCATTHGHSTASCMASPLVPSDTVPSRARVSDPDVLKFTLSPSLVEGPAQGYLEVSLRNVSAVALWLNYGMRLGDKESQEREIWLDVQNPSTGSAPKRACVAAGKGVVSGGNDYMVLAPGAAVSRIAVLDCYPGLPGRGPWHIVAHYDGGKRLVPPPPPGTRWFSGTVESNVVQIEVKPPP